MKLFLCISLNHVRGPERSVLHESFGRGDRCDITRQLSNEVNPPRLSFSFVLEMPKGLRTPRSLRHLLHSTYFPTLNERIEISKQLANSVLFLHSTQFVHKNIRPERIIIFPEPSGASVFGPLFLVGFEFFRPVGGVTFLGRDPGWERELYRHPSHQSSIPEQEYVMQHDIYSLGVCLLEIGLWKSSIGFQEANDKSISIAQWDISSDLDIVHSRTRAVSIQKKLIHMANEQLPRNMGQTYTDIVIACLTCLKPENPDLRDQHPGGNDDGWCGSTIHRNCSHALAKDSSLRGMLHS